MQLSAAQKKWTANGKEITAVFERREPTLAQKSSGGDAPNAFGSDGRRSCW